jgi:hypothetical protein
MPIRTFNYCSFADSPLNRHFHLSGAEFWDDVDVGLGIRWFQGAESPTSVPADEVYWRAVEDKLKPFSLSDHLKNGQRLSLQNRPTGLAVQD